MIDRYAHRKSGIDRRLDLDIVFPPKLVLELKGFRLCGARLNAGQGEGSNRSDLDRCCGSGIGRQRQLND